MGRFPFPTLASWRRTLSNRSSPGSPPPVDRPRHLSIPNTITLLTVTFLMTLSLSGWVAGVHPPTPPASLPGACAPAAVPSGAGPGDYLNLSVFTDVAQGREFLVPAGFTVPSGALVHISITNYDPTTSPTVPGGLEVCGTRADLATVAGSLLHTFGTGDVSHTFTVYLGPSETLNVPIPPRTGAEPSTVSFSTYFPVAGTYLWQSQTDLNDTPSSGHPDGMSGYITVL